MEDEKSSAFEPLSIKLALRVWPLDRVMKLSLTSSPNGIAVPKPLFDSVAIPKTREPLTVAAALRTDGNWRTTPLLSAPNKTPGFITWLLADISIGTSVNPHPELGQEKYAGGGD